MGNRRSKTLVMCTGACACVIASSIATARADERAAENIPVAEQKSEPASAAAPASELPLPYESWGGTGQLPPLLAAEREVPAPLARARELARRPFELTAAFAALLPSCGAGSIDDRGCLSVHAGGGVDAAFVYRVTPYFGVGAEGVLSGFAGSSGGALSGGGGSARFGGVVGRLYFAESGAWDPYLALTLGVGSLKLRSEAAQVGATTGLGARVAGGIDYLLGSHLRIGPSASFTHWVAWNEQECTAGVCRDQALAYGRLLGFATLGLRVTGSFGDRL